MHHSSTKLPHPGLKEIGIIHKTYLNNVVVSNANRESNDKHRVWDVPNQFGLKPGISIATSKTSKYGEYIPTQTYPLINKRIYGKSHTINGPFSTAMLNYLRVHKHRKSETLTFSRGHVGCALSQHQLGIMGSQPLTSTNFPIFS